MHSLRGSSWLLFASTFTVVRAAVVPPPAITPAPLRHVEAWSKRQELDPIDFAQLLLTAMPVSLRQIAATNVAAVSSILYNEFLDDNKPQWFLDLPWEVQSYLVHEFGPETAWLTSSPVSSAESTASTTTDSLTASTTTDSLTASSGGSTSTVPSASEASSLPTPSSATPSPTSASVSASTSDSTSDSTSAPTSSSTSSATSSSTSSSTSSATSEPEAPAANTTGLTKNQKIGMGVGIPLGILAAAAVLFGCCFLLRRRRKGSRVNGSERASSPGFIPHFAFQDTSTDNLEHRIPLNPSGNQYTPWDDELAMPPPPMASSQTHPSTTANAAATTPSMTMHQDSTPIMAPVLFHTHSSNRARGKRTSYTSLHSVAEVSEPSDYTNHNINNINNDDIESPVLGRHNWPRQNLRRASIPEHAQYSHPPPQHALPAAPAIKRKPVSTNLSSSAAAAGAVAATLAPPRPSMRTPDNSGSTLSSSAGGTYASNSTSSVARDAASPVSPLGPSGAQNPFANGYAYVEDFGPEYAASGYGNPYSNANNNYDNYNNYNNNYPDPAATHAHADADTGYGHDYSYTNYPSATNGYVDVEDGAFGGHRSLDAYAPAAAPPRRSSKTEWPLRSVMGSVRRVKSPMWDRVYDD